MTSVTRYAFYDCELRRLTVPDSVAAVGETVVFRVDGVAAGSVRAKRDGSFTKKLRLAEEPVSGHSYQISAYLKNNETAVGTVDVRYKADAPVLKRFEMVHSGGERVDLLEGAGGRLTNTLVPGYPFRFELEFEHPEALGSVYVSSTKSGVTRRMQAFPTGNPGEYVTEGYFHGADEDYVPGALNVVYNLYVSEAQATAEISEEELPEWFRGGSITILEDTDTVFAFDYTLADETAITTRLTVLPIEDYLTAQGVPAGELDGAELMGGGRTNRHCRGGRGRAPVWSPYERCDQLVAERH